MFSLINIMPRGKELSFSDLFDNSLVFPEFKVKEEKDKLKLFADMPGFDKKDIDIDIVDNLLCVSAKKVKEEKNKAKDSFYYSKSEKNISRSIDLGSVELKNKKKVNYKNGKLEVTLFKKSK